MPRYDIAIVGAGCIVPGALNTSEYWNNIKSGETFFSEMPKRLWHMEHFYSADEKNPYKSYSKVGAFVENFKFPYLEYRLPPKAMEGIGSAQLVAIEAVKQALREAGISPHSKILERGITVVGCSGVDVFVHSTAWHQRIHFWQRLWNKLKQDGVSRKDAETLLVQMSDQLKAMSHFWHPKTFAIGSLSSSISNRIAQVFGIHGFNTSVDAACSSSFVAIDTACHALMAGDADVAVAGGTDMEINPAVYIGFSRIGGQSRKGVSTPFDASADGLVMGEGTGYVVLKRLEDALENGDTIKGVIRGIGSSSDGAGQAIYTPSLKGRTRAFRKALSIAEVDSDDVQFIEAHATSTVVGDANEYDSIASVYGRRNSNRPLYLGSVKYQIGHLKAAAGAAGLIKTLLAMEHETIPHLPTFRQLTPHVEHSVDAMKIPTSPVNWPAEKGKRIAAITTSGFGGINYHCIVERADNYERPHRPPVPSRKMAIVAAKARVAGADSADEFWNNMIQDKDVFQEVNRAKEGWNTDFSIQPESEQVRIKRIGKMNPYKFNALKFKMFPTSLSQTSPSQLLALDLADQLLEECGIDAGQEKNIGVCIGSMHDDLYPSISMPICADAYGAAMMRSPMAKTIGNKLVQLRVQELVEEIHKEGPPCTEHTLPGWLTNITSGRIANKLNMVGPGFAVVSACSSGLASMIPAIYQLMFNDLDAVITGGTNMQTSEVFSSAVTQIGAVAQEFARPYDEAGQGFLIGEGGVLFLLKRLSDAKRDNDNIIAVVQGVSGSSEAKSKSLLAPTEEAIRLGMRQAIEFSGVQPAHIGVVDTHGSANLLSDVAEVTAIAKEMRPRGDSDAPPVQVLATKSHIGHLYGGSGASSILTVIMSLQHNRVPGIRHLKNLRPELTHLLQSAAPQQGSAPLHRETRAGGVNSMGLGGANYFGVFTGPDYDETKQVETDTDSIDNDAGSSAAPPSFIFTKEFVDYLNKEEPLLSAVAREAFKRFSGEGDR
ncbi:MAG: polyketide synthase [Deltaproteobacteria bacterium]|nr:polyketide synthase [Deltaproteobacteria bacterium]MBN2672619.1 polyketide synthase [Deltaproteobacteria bacterium]